MKGGVSFAVGVIAVLFLAATVQATTLTFDESTGNNHDIPLDHGSNVAGDSTGIVTTDGTGVTPDIALTWAPSPNAWEYHSGANFVTRGFDAPIAQLQCNPDEPDPTILFEAAPNAALVLNSLDIANAANYTGPEYSWTITLTRQSDDTVVFTDVTPVFTADTSQPIYTVDFDFTGDLGEDYLLRFDDGGVDRWHTAMDNLSYSQVPEPSTVALLLAGLLGLVGLRGRK